VSPWFENEAEGRKQDYRYENVGGLEFPCNLDFRLRDLLLFLLALSDSDC